MTFLINKVVLFIIKIYYDFILFFYVNLISLIISKIMQNQIILIWFSDTFFVKEKNPKLKNWSFLFYIKSHVKKI